MLTKFHRKYILTMVSIVSDSVVYNNITKTKGTLLVYSNTTGDIRWLPIEEASDGQKESEDSRVNQLCAMHKYAMHKYAMYKYPMHKYPMHKYPMHKYRIRYNWCQQ